MHKYGLTAGFFKNSISHVCAVSALSLAADKVENLLWAVDWENSVFCLFVFLFNLVVFFTADDFIFSDSLKTPDSGNPSRACSRANA